MVGYRGSFNRKLDEKNRLALPSEYRKVLLGKDLVIVEEKERKRLLLYTEEEWNKAADNIKKNIEPLSPGFFDNFSDSSHKIEIDKRGRILISKNVIEGTEIVIKGADSHFEIFVNK